MYGIITALPSENGEVVAKMTEVNELVLGGVNYKIGYILDKKVVTVTTGIGKINAAAITSRIIDKFQLKAVFLVGISGGINPKLTIGDVVVGTKLYSVESMKITRFKDDLVNQINKKTNVNILKANNYLLEVAKSVVTDWYKIIYGIIATTDIFPPYPRQIVKLKDIGADVVEMEGFAVMHVCWLFNIPCLVVRGISDYSTISLKKGYKTEYYDIKENNKKIAMDSTTNFIRGLFSKLN